MPQFDVLPDRPFESTRVADVKLPGSLIKWKHRVSLHEGLARTVKWYRENLHKANGKIAKKASSTGR